MISAFIISTLLSMAVAQQNSTLIVPLIGGDADMVAASVVGVSSEATTLALACIDTDCGLFPAHTLIVGLSTYNIDMSDPNTDFTATQDCIIASSSAVCMETAGGSEANFPGSSTTTYESSEVGQLTVTVTAGEDKLAQTGSESASSASASQTSAQGASRSASTASITPAPGLGSAAASAGVSSTGSAPAQASTAGAAINGMLFGGGFVGVAAGVFGGLLL